VKRDWLQILVNHNLIFIGLFLVLLVTLMTGCVMSNQAQSDWQWKQINPDYKPTAPPDGRPQWGVFTSPD
jgi:hypothetical protein